MSSETTPQPGRGPGRPRSLEADRAILEAAISVLSEMGYHGFTTEEVAARAGVSKATIYRRHPSKIALVAAAAAADRDARNPELDTGSFRGDLLAIGGHAVQMLTSVWGRVLPGVMGEAADDPEVERVLRAFFAWRIAAFEAIVGRATDRGEVRPGTDPRLVFTLMDGPLLMELTILRGPIDMALVERVVAGVIESVAVR
jgi:AcrR family transcriptional regulator